LLSRSLCVAIGQLHACMVTTMQFAALTFVICIKIDFLAAAFVTLLISPLFLLLLLLQHCRDNITI
jgi:hypothetical protein